jgi:ATP-dependent DNA ligase
MYSAFKELRAALAENLRVQNAIIEGEICCLDESGTPRFSGGRLSDALDKPSPVLKSPSGAG